MRCVDVVMEDLFMSFRFASKQRKENLQRCGDVFFDILIARELQLSVCF